MTKFVHDDVLDAALNNAKNNATRITVCSQYPTTFTQAVTTYKLVIKTISSSDFTGPADNELTGGGRKLTSNAHTGNTVDAEGDGTHIALVDFANEKVLYVTEVPTEEVQTLYTANTMNIPAWAIRIQDPV